MVTDFRHFAPKKVGAGIIARPFALYCRDNRPRPHYVIPSPLTMSFLCPHHVIPSVAEESRPHAKNQIQHKKPGQPATAAPNCANQPPHPTAAHASYR